MMRISVAMILGLAVLAGTVQAALTMPKCFSDNMVLQQGMPAPVWGKAAAGETITVRAGEQTKTTQADAGGAWMVRLDLMTAGDALEMVVEGASSRLVFRNVAVGEVWLCSGQSNMAWTVARSANAEQELAQADLPKIRLLGPNGWQLCTPQTAAKFSGVGFFFGRRLHESLGVPVGLINRSVGGTSAGLWTSVEAMAAVPELQPYFDRYEKSASSYPAKLEAYEAAMRQWKASTRPATASATAASSPATVASMPAQPKKPNSPQKLGSLYESMIRPLIPYAIRGVIWYQGESDSHWANEYAVLFPAMIESWRADWGRDDLPFLFVQLANYGHGTEWPQLREAQTRALALPHTAMVVAADLGDPENIHFPNKQDVGLRLAMTALKDVYGQPVTCAFPRYAKCQFVGDCARISFGDMTGQLVAKEGKLVDFQIAGPDRRFVPAEARIEGDSVVVRSAQVSDPKAVRYAWSDSPSLSLYTSDGLPACPFRTDDWPFEPWKDPSK